LTTLTTTHPPRALRCAIGHLSDAAVGRRYRPLARDYPPMALAEHLASMFAGPVGGNHQVCDGTERSWWAGAYRWLDVRDALERDDHPRNQPHPRTSEWQARGLDLTGMTAARQLAELRRRITLAGTDRTLIDGTGTPPEHHRLATALSNNTTPADRLAEATSTYLRIGSNWTVDLLANPQAPNPERKDTQP
jgi:hypothetical protein